MSVSSHPTPIRLQGLSLARIALNLNSPSDDPISRTKWIQKVVLGIL